MGSTRQRKALVVGAGPVGALTALSLHRRGWEVEIWESRDGMSFSVVTLLTSTDPRGQSALMTNLRSINLAISARGLEALRSVDPTLGKLLSLKCGIRSCSSREFLDGSYTYERSYDSSCGWQAGVSDL